MPLAYSSWFPLWITLLLPYCVSSVIEEEYGTKVATFLSPKFVPGPGSVENKYYYNIDFPRGHIAVKSFNAEVVDEDGNAVPLHETYLHHWVVGRYFQRIDAQESNESEHSSYMFARNGGICQRNVLGQYFGLGSETRRTATNIPDPYGIEIGNPAEIPAGFEERWMLNVHAIDTRGVEDRLGCTECRCDLYNVTIDEYGRPLRPDYRGGLLCCYDGTQCQLMGGYQGTKRNLYLRYTVVWAEWKYFIIPVQIYILDITDTQKILKDSLKLNATHDCRIEYEVEACSNPIESSDKCIDIKRTSLNLPKGGYVIYGVAHQHSGGVGANLYGEDGRLICSSEPTYGEGKEAGNEDGYIVGMSTCYPQPGSVTLRDWETVVLESKYSSTQNHTGVMGLFYLLVAEQLPNSNSAVYSRSTARMQRETAVPNLALIAAFAGVVIVLALSLILSRRTDHGDGYQSLVVA